MMVRRGWAYDYGKQKFDVEMTETDLARLFIEHGMAPGAVFDPAGSGPTLYEMFQIMDAHVQAISKTTESVYLAGRDPELAGQLRAQVAEHVKLRNATLAKVKERQEAAS